MQRFTGFVRDEGGPSELVRQLMVSAGKRGAAAQLVERFVRAAPFVKRRSARGKQFDVIRPARKECVDACQRSYVIAFCIFRLGRGDGLPNDRRYIGRLACHA
jgi:hypothetical protein